MHILYWICVTKLVNYVSADVLVKRFIVVSGISSALEFYPEIRDWFPQPLQNLPDVDADAKRQICRNITSSHLFTPWRECPDINFSSSYRSRPIRVIIDKHLTPSRKVKEDVFKCKTRRDRSVKTYYISKEYNLNVGEGISSTDNYYLPGRFIFHHSYWDQIMLYGLAEPPAETFFSPDYDIEHVYLQRRREFGVAWSNEEDALCRLDSDERDRICVAVFNSGYFAEKVSYTDAVRSEGSCRLKTVSLQTKHGRRMVVAGKQFRERMLSCKKDKMFHYLLSHAYQSNQTFVYFFDRASKHVFLENLTTNVRLKFTRDSHLSLTREP